MRLNKIASVAFLSCILATTLAVHAAPVFSVDITVDEFGNGHFENTAGFTSPLLSALLPDPGPGGAPAALTYDLLSPPGLTTGDLVLIESGGASVSDVVRFNAGQVFPGAGTGTLVFYSDNTDGIDSLADVTGLPGALYANNLVVLEVGPEGANGFDYTPTAGQPGFVTGAGGPVTYHLISDGLSPFAVPLPTSALAGLILLTLFASFRTFHLLRRRQLATNN